MSEKKTWVKDPAAVLDYGLDWVSWLDGRNITQSTWHVEPSEPGGVVAASPEHQYGKTSVMLSGGNVGRLYMVTNRIVTNASTTEERSMLIRIEQR